ncbi:MAG: ATP-binding protein [Dechloromonas sp.]|nr:ATP-binding protein [Dechloromonas sp.]
MTPAASNYSLARQTAWLLATLFIVFECLAASAVVLFLMAPMAQRAADDLAGLMLLSAQTWRELPPETRADFEIELASQHTLSLSEHAPGEVHHEWHGVYLYYLEHALAQKTGEMRHLLHSQRDGEDWLWAKLPSGNTSLAVGFPARRIATQPLRAMLLSLIAGLALAILAALWFARKITQPLAQLETAAAQLGQGETPTQLPESGPRELAQLAQRFNQMARQVQELLAARTTMLAGISHDLRTPLARIRLALALLDKQAKPALVQRIEADIDEMDRLISDVLTLSRDLSEHACETVDLKVLVQQLATSVSSKRLQLSIPEQTVIVQARRLALQRIISNLLENALRYGAEQPVQLRIETHPHALLIGLLDHGPGIPDALLDDVFLPFHRVDASRSPQTGGSGLGLAIVRQLANANGWQVALSNRNDGGLAAWLSLPIDQEASDNRQKQATQSAKPTRAPATDGTY